MNQPITLKFFYGGYSLGNGQLERFMGTNIQKLTKDYTGCPTNKEELKTWLRERLSENNIQGQFNESDEFILSEQSTRPKNGYIIHIQQGVPPLDSNNYKERQPAQVINITPYFA